MRVLFTADLHIRIGQKNIPKEWARKQYRIMFDEFHKVFEFYDCDLEVHGGDIFDKAPNMEELFIYMRYIWETPSRPRILYDGNHEATKKGSTFLQYIKPYVPLDTSICNGVGNYCEDFDILPYTDLHNLKNIRQRCPILLTHVRGDIPPHVKAEVDLKLFDKWDIVFAGDLHAHSNSQRNIVYPGSPRTVTFHRNEVKLGVIVFDTDKPKDWEWVEIKVPQLIRKTIDNPDDMIKTDFNHTIYELTGSVLDLSKIDKDSELLDKKIINNKELPTLDLSDLTIEEELELYLTKITNLSKPEVIEVMEIFNASI